VAAPDGNYELKKSQLFIEFPLIFISILKTVDRRKTTFFIQIIHSAAHFAAHGLCCPGGQPPLAHPPPNQLHPHL
jgi:hypothetical protein